MATTMEMLEMGRPELRRAAVATWALGRDGQLHNCDSTTMRWCWGDWPTVCILLGMQRFSRVERVTGIEPALSAWEFGMNLRSTLPWPDLT